VNKSDIKLVDETMYAFNAIPAHRAELIANHMITPYTLVSLVRSGDVTQISRKARRLLIDAMNVAGYVKEICAENDTYNLSHREVYQMATDRYETFINNLTPTIRANWYEYK
jgi:hypothetical protein